MTKVTKTYHSINIMSNFWNWVFKNFKNILKTRLFFWNQQAFNTYKQILKIII